MTGATIRDCSPEYGGAVHLEGGEVTVTGGNINGNVALNGNGGGISINSGSFTMSGYKIVRWNTRKDGLGTKDYHDGDIVKISSDLTLYAIWELE